MAQNAKTIIHKHTMTRIFLEKIAHIHDDINISPNEDEIWNISFIPINASIKQMHAMVIITAITVKGKRRIAIIVPSPYKFI